MADPAQHRTPESEHHNPQKAPRTLKYFTSSSRYFALFALLIAGCVSDAGRSTEVPIDQTPTTATTRPPATAAAPVTTAGQPVGVPAEAIVIDSSMNLAQTVADAPAGASFYFTAGTYRRVTINPKDGQTFIAQAGVTFDGENATRSAFVGPATNVAPSNITISGFEIKNYTPTERAGWNEGAITSKWYEGQDGGSGWVVENVNVHHNRGAGVMLTDRGVLRNSQIHHNYAIGVKVGWAPNGGVVEGNEISYNNFDSAPDFNETGGAKFGETNGLVVRNNWVHHNNGAGLWTDTDNHATFYEGNLVEDNAGPGIEHEISYSVTIRNNTVRRNGHNSQGWIWGAGILIATSSDANIEGNVLAGNQSGIGIVQQNRGSYQARNINVRNNQVTGPGWSGAVQDIGEPGYFQGRLQFEGNVYTNSTFVFGESTLTWQQWQALGHDLNGSVGEGSVARAAERAA